MCSIINKMYLLIKAVNIHKVAFNERAIFKQRQALSHTLQSYLVAETLQPLRLLRQHDADIDADITHLFLLLSVVKKSAL